MLLHDAVVAAAHDVGQALQDLEGDLGLALQQLEEVVGAEAGQEGGLTGEDAGRARLAVDHRQLAEGVARAHGGEGDLTAGGGEVHDVDGPVDDEEDLAPLAAAVEDLLVGAEAAPATARLETLALGLFEAFEQRHIRQRVFSAGCHAAFLTTRNLQSAALYHID